MIDNDGNISFWNAAAEKIFGYTELEALGKNMHFLLTPARFHEASGKGFAHFQHSGEGAVVGKTLELVARHQNGNEFPVELSLSAVNISGSWQAIGIIRDITARTQAESKLKLFRALLDSSSDAIEVLIPSHCVFRHQRDGLPRPGLQPRGASVHEHPRH